jgi:hypothetical protein
MPIPFEWDFKNPDYAFVFKRRIERLKALRQNPEQFSILDAYYRKNPAQFIIDWGCTLDPRNLGIGRPALIPFLLYPHQEKFVYWLIDRWRNQESGVACKSRAMGMTWLSVATAITLGLYNDYLMVSVGSRKEEYVDRGDDPKSIFHKARMFIETLPIEFRGGYDRKKHTKHRQLQVPKTGFILSGEAGNSIGRGDRPSIYLIDEAAHLSHPEETDTALSQTTPCCIYISTPNGPNNPFSKKYFFSTYPKFDFHWRNDPSKDEAWYKRECERLIDPVVIAQELDMDFNASVQNVVIPYAWISAAVDAHIKLNIPISGMKKAALDIADRGKDKNALGFRQNILLYSMDQWTGKESDIFKTCKKTAFDLDREECDTLIYDADGLGAGARGDFTEINRERALVGKKGIIILPFHGGGKVISPKSRLKLGKMETQHLNEDYFENRKAQGWWYLRSLFLLTYKAVIENEPYDPAFLISLSSKIPDLAGFMSELSQPTYEHSKTSKIMIEKQPEERPSPNRADCAMTLFAPERFRGF